MKSTIYTFIFCVSMTLHAKNSPNMYTCEGPGIKATLVISAGQGTPTASFSASGPWGQAVSEKSPETVNQEINLAGMRFWITPRSGDHVFSLFLPIIQLNPENTCEFHSMLSITTVPSSSEQELQEKIGVIFSTSFSPLKCVAQYIFM